MNKVSAIILAAGSGSRFGEKKQFKKLNGHPIWTYSLNTFIDLSLVWGTEPILMTQFNRINLEDELFNKISSSMINKEEYVKSYLRLNDVIREVSASRNVDLIDLANLIPSSSNYMYDAVHLMEYLQVNM